MELCLVNKPSLDSLPTECLCHILTFLNISDLTLVADCSHRFRALARHIFSQKHRREYFSWENFESRTICLFGDLVKILHIDRKAFPTVNRDFPNFRQLRLPDMSRGQVDHESLNTIKTKSIILDISDLDSGIRIDNSWDHLVMLFIGSCDRHLDSLLDGLQCASLKYVRMKGILISAEKFRKFAQNNSQLRGLELCIPINDHPIDLSGLQYLTNLEILRVGRGRLSRTLTINKKLEELLPSFYDVLAKMSSLRDLVLYFAPWYSGSIVNVKQLRCLQLPFYPYIPGRCLQTFWNDRLNDIANNMPDLEELLVPVWDLDANKLNFIKRATKLKRFLIDGGLSAENYMQLVEICTMQNRTIEVLTWFQSALVDSDIYRKYSHFIKLRVRPEVFPGSSFPMDKILDSSDCVE